VEFDRQKFKRLVHYIIWKVGKHDWFGATKLNKILWFVDARAYVLTGKPITGETYARGEFGPIPKHIIPFQNELERERTIRITKEGKLTRLVALTPAQPSWFSAEDHISLHGWGNASSIASRSTTAIGRELLSGCLRTYSNPISTICFALTNDLSSGTQILIGSLESRTKGLSRRISQAYKTCTQFFRSAHIDPHVGFKRSGSPRCPCCQEQHSNTG
jgi:Protein of unknown function (DUF4065)